MAPHHESKNQPLHPVSVSKRMLQGAGIAFIVIIFFVAGPGEHNPEWPKFWMVKPLVVVPLAGALGGLFFYNMDHLRDRGGWREVLANVLSLVVYIIVLWLGIVLGLNGTMWD